MNEEDIIARIERLEELAILTHGTLDVDKVKAQLRAMMGLTKKMQKDVDGLLSSSDETQDPDQKVIK